MSKMKIYLDLDNTVTNSTRAFTETYNLFYNFKKDFVPANWQLVDEWDFTDQCKLIKTREEVESIFGMQTFFAHLDFINTNTYEILQEINEKYHVILCSIGTYPNISLKSDFVRNKLPFIKDSIFLVNDGIVMDKKVINMSGGIFIDDVANNLKSSNADIKLAFGDIHSWNREWNGERCLDWTSVKERLL